MADNPYGADTDTTGVTSRGHVSGSNANSGWSRRMSSNAYAWSYIAGALILLWALGGSFRAVRA